MKIGFVLQNNRKGGLDTFVINLLNNWNIKDEKILYCNKSHPGLLNLTNKLKNVKIVKLNYLLEENLFTSLNILKKIIRKLFFFCNIFFIYFDIKKRLTFDRPDNLLIINGGFPGGEINIAFVLCWYFTFKKKCWVSLHNYAYKKQFTFDPFVTLLIYFLSKSIKGYVSVSKSCLSSLNEFTILKKVKKRLIYNGIYNNKVHKKNSKIRAKKTSNKNKNVLMLAVYKEHKGFDFIFKIINDLCFQNPNIKLHIYGDYSKSDYKNINKIRNKYFHKKNIYLNKHDHNPKKLFDKMDLLVVPSQNFESFGQVAAEAMLYNLPVVSTNFGGLKEVVQNNINGLTSDVNDSHKFKKNILKILNDSSYSNLLIKNANKIVKQKFVVQKMVNQYYSLIVNN